jgi:hypothetical protein
MTRKDYVLLAQALAVARPSPGDAKIAWITWRLDCKCIADALAADNNRFERQRFIDACEGAGNAK